MKITNETPFVAGNTLAFRQDGRELIVVVAKGTYVLSDPAARDGEPRLAEEQVPLVMADEFGEDPAKNATIIENDFAPIKPECEVLLAGSAHAPYERPLKAIGVGLRVGTVSKSFNVTGRRYWKAGLTGNPAAGEPDPTTKQLISYDVAFGGIEVDPKKPDRFEMYLENPVGRGFRKRNLDVLGQPMPLTEEISEPIRDPKKPYRPMAFGPLGRSWKPRMDYVGTYDQKWIDEIAPMLPADFNPLYFQAAPPDQRMAYPRGGEQIRLVNLVPPTISPDACAQSAIPKAQVKMAFVQTKGEPLWIDASLDTILIQPDENRFTCTWRTNHAAIRDAFEISEVVVCLGGLGSENRVRARLGGKQHYHGLAELVRARKGGRK